MSSAAEDQPTVSRNPDFTQSNAKTIKNRKYRKLQKEKRNATKQDQAQKIRSLNTEKVANAEKIERLVKDNLEKDKKLAEICGLLKESQDKVKTLENIIKAMQEGEMLLDSDCDF